MRDCLDDSDSSVQWGYLKFTVGEGTFSRQKLVFLHVNGERCPSIARGKANQYTPRVQDRLCRGGTGSVGPKGCSGKLEVSSKDEVTKESLFSRIANLFVSDDLGDHTVKWTLLDYEEQVREASRTACSDRPGRCVPGHRSSQLFSTGRDALQAVSETEGAWNWVLLRPDVPSLSLVAGGVGSLDEMRETMEEHSKEVLAGLLRMSFGEGRLRRSKHVLIFAVGSKTPAVARGKLAFVRPQVEKALSEFVQISCVVESRGTEDLALDAIIDKVRKATHIDDEVLERDTTTRQLWTADSFREALHEERRRTLAKARMASFAGRPLQKVVDLLHSDESLNWALFGLASPPRAPTSKFVGQ